MKAIPQVLKLANNELTIALSMGVDSLACAHFIKTKFPKIKLNCFHYDHNIQEDNMEMWMHYLRFLQDFDIQGDYRKRTEAIPEGSEEAGLRTLRYRAMASLKDVKTVAVCQQLDEAVESHMLRFLNGEDSNYLPIPLVTKYEDFGFTVIRPFMFNTKQDCIDYVKKHKLEKYLFEDKTNTDTSIRRNWLRHEILPEIQTRYNLKTIVRKKYEQWIKDNLISL